MRLSPLSSKPKPLSLPGDGLGCTLLCAPCPVTNAVLERGCHTGVCLPYMTMSSLGQRLFFIPLAPQCLVGWAHSRHVMWVGYMLMTLTLYGETMYCHHRFHRPTTSAFILPSSISSCRKPIVHNLLCVHLLLQSPPLFLASRGSFSLPWIIPISQEASNPILSYLLVLQSPLDPIPSSGCHPSSLYPFQANFCNKLSMHVSSPLSPPFNRELTSSGL